MDAEEFRPRRAMAPGLALIVVYKMVKGGLSLLASVILLASLAFGYASHLHDVASRLKEHATHAWALQLADLLLSASEGSHLALVALALFFDGALTTAEGIGLRQGWWWAPWMVVVATGSLIPFEIAALFRAVHVGRVLIFAINAAIVVYLARRAWREHRARPPAGPAPTSEA